MVNLGDILENLWEEKRKKEKCQLRVPGILVAQGLIK